MKTYYASVLGPESPTPPLHPLPTLTLRCDVYSISAQPLNVITIAQLALVVPP